MMMISNVKNNTLKTSTMQTTSKELLRFTLPCIIWYYILINIIHYNILYVILYESRVGAAVRALAFHQCNAGLISCPAVICGLSLLVLYSVLWVFPHIMRFSLLTKSQHLIDLICCDSVWFVSPISRAHVPV